MRLLLASYRLGLGLYQHLIKILVFACLTLSFFLTDLLNHVGAAIVTHMLMVKHKLINLVSDVEHLYSQSAKF